MDGCARHHGHDGSERGLEVHLHRVETGQGTGVFKDWTSAQVDQPAPAAATDPTFATINNGNGQTTFFVYRTVNGTPIFAV